MAKPDKQISTFPVTFPTTNTHVVSVSAPTTDGSGAPELIPYSVFTSNAQGPRGPGQLVGTGAPTAGVGADGDIYTDSNTGDLYGPKASGAWPSTPSGNVKGPEGPQGPAGPAGSRGPAGPAGPQGAQGPIGPDGAQGAVGPTGPQGPAGAGLLPDEYGNIDETKIAAIQTAGIDWVYVVNPNGDLRSNKNVPAGIAGDMERHVVRYNSATGTWHDYGQFTGVQGPQGPAGPAGSQGPQGPAGSAGATGAQGPQGPQGPSGSPGSAGATGPAGLGLPTGGATGQVARKKSATDYDTEWTSTHELPAGGTTNQVLVKNSNTDYDVKWANQSGGGGGGSGSPSPDGVYVINNSGIVAGGYYIDLKAAKAKNYNYVFARILTGNGTCTVTLKINGVEVDGPRALGGTAIDTAINVNVAANDEVTVIVKDISGTINSFWYEVGNK